MEMCKDGPWVGLLVLLHCDSKTRSCAVGEIVGTSEDNLPLGPMLHVRPLGPVEKVEQVLPFQVRVLFADPFGGPEIERLVAPNDEPLSRYNIGIVAKKGIRANEDSRTAEIYVINLMTLKGEWLSLNELHRVGTEVSSIGEE